MKIMHRWLVVSSFILGFGAGLADSAQASPETVPYVDLSRYVGNWYQISHIPLWFEGGKCACARQTLSAGENGVVKVFNSCNDGNPRGKPRSISGEAYNDDPSTNAKFTVDFHLPIKGTYWIVGLDAQYRYAVVTDKDGNSLYVLAKTPELSPELYQEAVALAQAKGLQTSKLESTEQVGCSYP